MPRLQLARACSSAFLRCNSPGRTALLPRRKDHTADVPYPGAMAATQEQANQHRSALALLHSRRQMDWLLRLARIQILTTEASLARSARALEKSQRLLGAVLDPCAPIPFKCCSEPAALLELDGAALDGASAEPGLVRCRTCGRCSAHRPMGAHEAVAYRVHLRALLGVPDGDWLAYLVAQLPSLERGCTCDHVELLAACKAYEDLGPVSSWLSLGVTEQLTRDAEAALSAQRTPARAACGTQARAAGE